jgi:hypothetical protein
MFTANTNDDMFVRCLDVFELFTFELTSFDILEPIKIPEFDGLSYVPLMAVEEPSHDGTTCSSTSSTSTTHRQTPVVPDDTTKFHYSIETPQSTLLSVYRFSLKMFLLLLLLLLSLRVKVTFCHK